ncbi:hypothetical protein [Actinomadura sp. BRA 177]|uniref:hypothetical protein n=1 Tax=Actinomadura sp. BRA 177 TaxID=2745202 RepID=UPI001C3CAC97|nr:hypothetical protein [Actinomadura sp. BRA 177]
MICEWRAHRQRDREALETDVLAGFVLARAAAGLEDSTIAADVVHLEQVWAWYGRLLWKLEPADADVYFGKVLRAPRLRRVVPEKPRSM